jgi:hypothetical protein
MPTNIARIAAEIAVGKIIEFANPKIIEVDIIAAINIPIRLKILIAY